MTEELPSRQHNNPPEPILDLAATLDPAILAASVAAAFQAQQKRTDALAAAYGRYKLKLTRLRVAAGPNKGQEYLGIEDAELAGLAADFMRQVRAAMDDIDAKRLEFKRPVMDAAKVIDASFTVTMLDGLDAIRLAVQGNLTDFVRRQQAAETERQRVAREAAAAQQRQAAQAEAARLAQAAREAEHDGDIVGAMEIEAAAAEQRGIAAAVQAAPAPVAPAPVAAVRSSAGSTLSTRTTWKWRETDRALLPPTYRLPNGPMLDALLKTDPSIKKEGKQPVPGIEFYAETSAATR